MNDEALPIEANGVIAALSELPFVSQTGDSFWLSEPTGHDATDIDLGERYALLAIEAARKCNSPVLLAFILRDMVKGGTFTALEAGFLSSVASAAKAGVLN